MGRARPAHRSCHAKQQLKLKRFFLGENLPHLQIRLADGTCQASGPGLGCHGPGGPHIALPPAELILPVWAQPPASRLDIRVSAGPDVLSASCEDSEAVVRRAEYRALRLSPAACHSNHSPDRRSRSSPGPARRRPPQCRRPLPPPAAPLSLPPAGFPPSTPAFSSATGRDTEQRLTDRNSHGHEHASMISIRKKSLVCRRI